MNYAWALFALLGAVGLAALICTAMAYAGHQQEAPWLLQPDRWFTAAAVAVAWALALSAYWAPRRRQSRPVAAIVIVMLTSTAALLVLTSTVLCTPNADQDHVGDLGLTPLWQTMTAFVGTSPTAFEEGGGCYGAVPLAAQLGRTAAMAAVFGAAVALGFRLGSRQIARMLIRARVVRDVVIGANDTALPLIRALVSCRGARHNEVVVLVADLASAEAERAARLGAKVFAIRTVSPDPVRADDATRGEAQERQQMERALAPFLTRRRRFTARRIWIMEPDLDVALRLADAVECVYARSARPRTDLRPNWSVEFGHAVALDPTPRVAVRCDDRRLAEKLRTHWIKTSDALGAADPDRRPESPKQVVKDPLCLAQVTAAEVVGRVIRREADPAVNPEALPYALVLCGDTALTHAIAAEQLIRAWEETSLQGAWQAHRSRCGHAPQCAGDGFPRHDPRDLLVGGRVPGRLVLVSSSAGLIRSQLLADTPSQFVDALGGPDAIVAVAQDWREIDPTSAADPFHQASDERLEIVFTDSAGGDDENRAARLRDALQVSGCTVWLPCSMSEGARRMRRLDDVEVFEVSSLLDGHLPEDSWSRIARHHAEDYRLRNFHPEPVDGWVMRLPWWHGDDLAIQGPKPRGRRLEPLPGKVVRLSEFGRQDNLDQVRALLANVASLGYEWQRLPVQGVVWQPRACELEYLAREEHARWKKIRETNGWRYDEKRNDEDKLHNHLAAWSPAPGKAGPHMTGEDRQWNRGDIQALLGLLAAYGFHPHGELRCGGVLAARAQRHQECAAVAALQREDNPAVPLSGGQLTCCYRRTGEVTARRLDAATEWKTQAGDVLRGDTGDWLVTSPDGEQHTVKDQQFRDGHEHVAGDRWRRRGTVAAEQVDRHQKVRTLEGEATARPGDWILTDEDGARWPVPDEVFRARYERV